MKGKGRLKIRLKPRANRVLLPAVKRMEGKKPPLIPKMHLKTWDSSETYGESLLVFKYVSVLFAKVKGHLKIRQNSHANRALLPAVKRKGTEEKILSLIPKVHIQTWNSSRIHGESLRVFKYVAVVLAVAVCGLVMWYYATSECEVAGPESWKVNSPAIAESTVERKQLLISSGGAGHRYIADEGSEGGRPQSVRVVSENPVTRRGGSFRIRGKDDEDEGPIIYPDDVYIAGIPMIDQGNRKLVAYSVAAAAARVLQGYGIEVTLEDFVALAGSSGTEDTDISNWENELSLVANEHGLRLKTVTELTESCTPLSALLYNYNNMAESMDYPELDMLDYLPPGVKDSLLTESSQSGIDKREIWSYLIQGGDRQRFRADRAYRVQRNVMLTDNLKCEAFGNNVVDCIEESDPIFWLVTFGDVPEQRVDTSESTVRYYKRYSHMRLIVGYNDVRDEVIYSDSWGEGHAHKRMKTQDALSITTGMYYLSDIGQGCKCN